MAHEDQQPRKSHLPLDPNAYQILNEIGRGCSAVVYKALCTTTAAVVAIKSIDLDRSTTADGFDHIRREANAMSLLSHPNLLRARCSFTVGSRLWVVMPFMSAGSLQSIISACFPDGISEACISIVLKETLMGLCYLHDQGHLHRDIKAGNILMDADGSIKLGDFGVSACVYESNSGHLRLNEIAGTPYWMAPEVIHSHNGYSYKADIWSFGITALELAHGRPPLSHLPFSKSLVMRITKHFRFSDYEKDEEKRLKNAPKFSKHFKDMVALCLDQDPSKRPSASKLLKHPFFKNCKGCDFLVRNLLQGLPPVEKRFKKIVGEDGLGGEEDDDDDECLVGSNVKKHRRISGWNFNVDGFELDPVFPDMGSQRKDANVKEVGIVDGSVSFDKERDPDGSESRFTDPGGGGGGGGGSEGVDKEVVVESLMTLKRSLDDQREKVVHMLALVGEEEGGVGGGGGGDGGGGGGGKEEKLVQVIENLRMELENEKRKRGDLEMELEFLKLQITCVSDV